MRTYKQFSLILESVSNIQRINDRLRKLNTLLNRVPNTPRFKRRRDTIKRAINKLQKEKQHIQTSRENTKINKTANTIRRYTPEPIRRGAKRVKNFVGYTGAGIALRALGL
jgi:hypothetical protein